MPAGSQAQQGFMAGCLHNPRHMKGKCPDMTKKQLRDFAATPTKNLPKKTGGTKRGSFRY